ncbi:hypothetical protein BH10BAC5_BH10BAC5_21530 [soil metagenome]
MKIAKKICIKGTVQAVGYRYYAYTLAKQYEVKGYALNHYNGDLEVVAVGEDIMVNDFIENLKHGPAHSRVDDVKIEDIKEIPDHQTFEIK